MNDYVFLHRNTVSLCNTYPEFLTIGFEVQGLQYLINDKHIQLPKFSLGFSPIMFWFMGGNPKH